MDLMVHATGHGDWTVVSIGGELDLSTAPRLRGELLIQITSAGRSASAGARALKLALDLRGVGFIDSIGLGVLIGARRRVIDAGGSLMLVHDSSRLAATFEAAGLSGLFDTVTSVEEL
jgi:anti-sigma B factor antagonist